MNKQDAIKSLKNIVEYWTYRPTEIEAAKLAISALEKQLNNGWIPVSERLPKEGRYLVTTVYGEVKESEFDLKKWWQIDNSTISLEWEEEPIKVVAWQNLPDPYKETATDNNVVTKSGKDNNAKEADLSTDEAQELKAERDYWEREAKKWCAKLGEIKMFVDKPN